MMLIVLRQGSIPCCKHCWCQIKALEPNRHSFPCPLGCEPDPQVGTETQAENGAAADARVA